MVKSLSNSESLNFKIMIVNFMLLIFPKIKFKFFIYI